MSNKSKNSSNEGQNSGFSIPGLGGFISQFKAAGLMTTVTLVATGLCVGTLVIGSFSLFGGIFGGLGRLFSIEPTSATITDSRTIVQSIMPMGQLVSLEVQLAKADIQVGVRSGMGNMCGYSATYVAQGALNAGVDLADFSETDVVFDVETNTWYVTLPAPQLTSCRIDYSRRYELTTAVGCPRDLQDVDQLARWHTLVEFREDALEGGILERAELESTLLLTTIISTFTDSEVEISYREAEGAVIPPSCEPEPPNGWVFNEEENSWQVSG